MTQSPDRSNALPSHASPAPPPSYGAAGDDASMLKQVHRLLRGRYWLAIPLAVIGLVAGGFGGWSLAPEPTYRSTASIRVNPTVTRVLYPNEHNQVPPMFDAFLEAQTHLVQSERVLQRALENAALREYAATRDVDEGMIRAGLSTRHGGQIIQVRFDDESPAFAQAVVTAVVQAYDEIYGEQSQTDDSERMRILEQRRTTLRNEVSSLRDRITTMTDEQGAGALEERYRHRLQEALRLEARLRELRLAISRAERAQGEGETQPAVEAAEGIDPTADELAEAVPAITDMAVEELAEYDPELSNLVDQRENVELRLAESEARFGPNHRDVKGLRNTLKVLDDRIANYLEQNRELLVERIAQAGNAFGAGMSLEEMKEQEQELAELYATAEEEANELGRRRLQIQELQEDIAVAEGQLADTRQRIESLNVESLIGGRIEVVSDGNRPSKPYQDQRAMLAGALGFGGTAMGLGVVLLMGLMDKRLRTPDDTQHELYSAPLLGILPQLPADLADLEGASMAAHAVHHIRTLLQIGMERNRAKVIATLSPSPGDGKTSLCHALGLSFAQARSRTLMIDCDLVGGRLSTTATSIARRRIGRILQRQGAVTQEQLDEALAVAQSTGRRIGEILVERGHLTDEHLAAALDAQRHDAMGVLDVAAGEPLENCTVPTGADNLYLLPLGSAEARHAPHLSPTALQQILAKAREEFDIVLIDTGPMLGSLEASLVATQADASVMVVSRGSQRPDVERAMQELHRMGAPVAGVVFNRATEYDITRYGVSQSHRFSAEYQSRRDRAGEPQQQHYGPMARAIGSTASTTSGNGYINGSGKSAPDDPR